MKDLIKKYPEAYAVYDIGKFYGVCIQESLYFVDKNNLEIVKALPRYDKEALEIIENAIPVWFAEDED